MPTTSGTKVVASDFNNIWNLVSNVLGIGAGQYGFYQTLSSQQVSVGKKFLLSDWVNLRSDLLKIGAHQTGSATEGNNLQLPGNLKPTTISSATVPVLSNGVYVVTFAIPIQTVAPSIGSSYKITGCANTAYNGTYNATSSTTTSITVTYNNNPGTYNPSSPVLIASVLTAYLVNQYQTYANNAYTQAYKNSISITGTTSTGPQPNVMLTSQASIDMIGATVSGPGIPVGTVVTSVSQGLSITMNNNATSTNSSATYVITLLFGRKIVAANQTATTSLTTVTRSTSWNQNIQTTATLTFRDSNGNVSYDAARAFFNAGSQIEIAPSLSGTFSAGSSIKDQTWQTMFNQVGKIILRANYTTQDNTSTGGSGYDSSSSNPSSPTAVGWFQLTTIPTLIYTKLAPSGAYATNALVVYASVDATGTQLLITVQFQDNAGGTIDENVDGTLAVAFTTTYASGSNVSSIPPLSSTTPLQ
jgi:hypothetical protein